MRFLFIHKAIIVSVVKIKIKIPPMRYVVVKPLTSASGGASVMLEKVVIFADARSDAVKMAPMIGIPVVCPRLRVSDSKPEATPNLLRGIMFHQL